tara:strand:+ start:1090 stop:1296 length:207 start_codon:yes stop_codon:yes gene_type:complete
MNPLIDKLEKELKITVTRLEMWHDSKNKTLFDKHAKDKCMAVPFFFNEKNEKFICGKTTYDKLKEWAK